MLMSPPAWWCGLKCHVLYPFKILNIVTTCVVVWIEICLYLFYALPVPVTTCVVVWIEISKSPVHLPLWKVTTCVVVWIEMCYILIIQIIRWNVTTCVVVWIEITS